MLKDFEYTLICLRSEKQQLELANYWFQKHCDEYQFDDKSYIRDYQKLIKVNKRNIRNINKAALVLLNYNKK
jgi:hypothetical protein